MAQRYLLCCLLIVIQISQSSGASTTQRTPTTTAAAAAAAAAATTAATNITETAATTIATTTTAAAATNTTAEAAAPAKTTNTTAEAAAPAAPTTIKTNKTAAVTTTNTAAAAAAAAPAPAATTNITASITTTNTTAAATLTTTTSTTTATPEVVTLAAGAYSQDNQYEFEDALATSQEKEYMIYRSAASGNRTMHLTNANADKKFVATLCVNGSGDNIVKIQVLGIVYSNDGPSDEFILKLDNNVYGSVNTDAAYNEGAGWNVLKNTGPFGKAMALSNGNHSLSVAIITDQWGAELDYISVRVHNQYEGENVFCSAELV